MNVLALDLFKQGVGVERGYRYRWIMKEYIVEKRTELSLAGDSRGDVCCEWGEGRVW